MHFSNWQNKLTAIWLIFLVIIAIGLGFTWMQKGIHIQTNIFALLPKVKQDKQLEQTEHYVSEQLNNKVFLVIDAKSSEQIEQATQILRAGVQQSNLFKPLKAQVDTEDFARTFSVHDKFHRALVLSGFFFLKIASTFLNSSFFPKPIKRRIAI